MKRPVARARRGQVGLVRIRSGCWGIRWGRQLSRRAGVPLVESTQTPDHAEALQILDRRRIEVYRALGDEDRANAAMKSVAAIALESLVSGFLCDYKEGNLPGRKPSSGTVDLCVTHLLGKRGGLTAFAKTLGRSLTTQLDCVLITRWLEAESRRLSNDSIRMKLIARRHLVRYAHRRGLVSADTMRAVLALRPPPSARGRARTDGVPSMSEVARLIEELKPRPRDGGASVPWHRIAELQLRLGLRRSEVTALDETWLDASGITQKRPKRIV